MIQKLENYTSGNRSSAVVTIFGGSGFVGRYVTELLAKQGWRIRIAVRRPERAEFLRPVGDVGQIAFIHADVTKPDSIARVVAGSDAVINLTGLLAPGGGRQNFTQLQAIAPGNIARICQEMGVGKFVHMSAIGADAHSQSQYARSKFAGEQACLQHYPQTVILRPSVIFGAEDKFFNLFAKLACLSPILPLIGGGHTRLQPIYVGDVAQAVIAALGQDHMQGKIFELGGEKILTLHQIMQLTCQHIGRKRLFIPLPFWFAKIKAYFWEMTPWPLLTRDQVTLLQYDNVVADSALTFSDIFGRDKLLSGACDILPSYLGRFRTTS